MYRKILETQRSVGIILAFTGVVGFTINLISYSMIYSFQESISHLDVYASLIIAVIFFFTAVSSWKFTRIVQGIALLIIGTMAVLDRYDSAYGAFVFLIFVFLGFDYKWFDTRRILKIALISAYFIGLAVVSLIVNYGIVFSLFSIDAVISVIAFVLIMIIIHQKRIIKSNVKNKATIDQLIEEKTVLEKDIEEKTSRVGELNSLIRLYHDKHLPVDLSIVSPAERRVLEVLCVYRETDKEIGKRLNVSENTIGVHMQHIRDKLGVDTRLELIELCRNNFI